MHFFIHSYYGAVLGFSLVTGLAKKLYIILHTLSVVFSEMLAVSLIGVILFNIYNFTYRKGR
ncbi:hypothetical protein COA27_17640 [Bacillus cereus]|nr:hypothetical protein COJ06_06495 [Bacillus cereus]PGQ69967.1 hypothetical protein COA27_17640 [Bacillus cereus]